MRMIESVRDGGEARKPIGIYGSTSNTKEKLINAIHIKVTANKLRKNKFIYYFSSRNFSRSQFSA